MASKRARRATERPSRSCSSSGRLREVVIPQGILRCPSEFCGDGGEALDPRSPFAHEIRFHDIPQHPAPVLVVNGDGENERAFTLALAGSGEHPVTRGDVHPVRDDAVVVHAFLHERLDDIHASHRIEPFDVNHCVEHWIPLPAGGPSACPVILAYVQRVPQLLPVLSGKQASEKGYGAPSLTVQREEPRPMAGALSQSVRGSDEIVLPHIAPRSGEARHPVHDHGRDEGDGIDEDNGGAVVMPAHVHDAILSGVVLLNALA